MSKPFIEPLELFTQKYPHPLKKLPSSIGWLTLLADPVSHPGVIDFIERLAAENHSMAEAMRMLNSLPKSVDGYNCFIGSPSFSATVSERVRSNVQHFESSYRHAMVEKLTELGIENPVDVAMQVAYKAGFNDGYDC
jgi:hypothetical protein